MGVDNGVSAPGAPPLASMLLIGYQQQASIAAAIAGALSQTYARLEIVISDDASTDGTFAAMQAAVAGYCGPHRLILNRNPVNLGIGAHLSALVALSHGDMLFVAAGDDISLPQRCERVMQAWLDTGRRTDLVASALVDIDADGQPHGTVRPTDLSTYRNAADWLARPPFVVGAAQAWTRRLFERFGPLPAGVVAEDMLMVFRAIGAGGAVTLDDALVQYRRGGISRRVRNLHAADVVRRLRKNSHSSRVELPLLLADAEAMGQLPAVEATLRSRLARENFVHALFDAASRRERLRILFGTPDMAAALRLRLGVYALCPALLAPLFFLKRLRRRH